MINPIDSGTGGKLNTISRRMFILSAAKVIGASSSRIIFRHLLPNVISNSLDATVIVADNNSTDDSVSYLKENFPNIQIIQNNGNYG